ncbi:MAG: element excision factor XisH family protein [Prochlorothrix sp.]
MPRIDLIHNAVKAALIKQKWQIIADPYILEYNTAKLYADLAADRPIAAEQSGRQIIVEVKSFLGLSTVQNLKEALGQYDIYLCLLETLAIDRKLYLALSLEAHQALQKNAITALVLEKRRIPLIIVNLASEEIVQWIH